MKKECNITTRPADRRRKGLWNYKRLDGRTKKEDREVILKWFKQHVHDRITSKPPPNLMNDNANSNDFHQTIINTATTSSSSSTTTRIPTQGNGSILLCSLGVSAVGLNLIKATKAYLLDPWWNPQQEEQAFQRLHRIGQKQHVQLYRLLVKQTVEEKVVKLHEIKKRVASQVLQEEISEEQGSKGGVEQDQRPGETAKSISGKNDGGIQPRMDINELRELFQ